MSVNYTGFEAIYSHDTSVSGWNTPAIDREVQGYVDELLDSAGIVPPARLLEIGCGMGNLSLPLARRGFWVTGIDISITAVDTAARRAAACDAPCRFVAGDITSRSAWMGLDRFDAVLDGLCMHCIIGEDRPRLLSYVRGALQPGGTFLVATMCGNPRSRELQRRFDPANRWVMGLADLGDHGSHMGPRCYLGLPEDLLAELESAGLRATQWRVQPGDDTTGDQDMLLAVTRTPMGP